MIKFITLALLLTTISCGGNDTSSDEKSHSNGTSKTSAIDKTPCQLVDESEIKALFDVPNDAITEIRDEVKTYPTCFYKWETATFPRTQIMADQEIIFNMPYEMTIVLVKNATPKMFETSTKVYKDGVSESEIGEMAIWGGTMSQLTFLAKGHMIHLHVKKSDNEIENKDLAKLIAKSMIEKL